MLKTRNVVKLNFGIRKFVERITIDNICISVS